jgi:hypothetical protein
MWHLFGSLLSNLIPSSAGANGISNRDEILSTIDEIGQRLCQKYHGRLTFESCKSKLPIDLVLDPPQYVPIQEHQMNGENQRRVIIETSSSSDEMSLTPLSQVETFGKEGCLQKILNGVCEDRNCEASHDQNILIETCRNLIQRLKQSKYNVIKTIDEENDEKENPISIDDDMDSFIVDDTPITSKKKSKTLAQFETPSPQFDSPPLLTKKSRREKMLVPVVSPFEDLYECLDREDDPLPHFAFTPSQEDVVPRERKIDLSNVLSKETWREYLRKIPERGNMLMIGSPHRAEVQLLQRHFKLLQIVEYR